MREPVQLELFSDDEAIVSSMRKSRYEIADENLLLRQMLAVSYSGVRLYSDDGELQDNSAFPFIDFKRDAAAVIQTKMAERMIKALGRLNQADLPAVRASR